MNIAFCDDNKTTLENLIKLTKNIIAKYDNYNLEFNFFSYTNPLNLLEAHLNNPFDVVFLDIVMPEISGLKVGDRLYTQNESIIIFYVTNYTEFIAESIKHRVYRFIKKGDERALTEGIQAMLKDFATLHQRYVYKYKGQYHSIVLNRIFYCESRGHNIRIVTDNDIFIQRILIKNLIKELPPIFCRCHSGYIVNLRKIRDVEKSKITLINGVEIPMSAKYSAEVIIKFTTYFWIKLNILTQEL